MGNSHLFSDLNECAKLIWNLSFSSWDLTYWFKELKRWQYIHNAVTCVQQLTLKHFILSNKRETQARRKNVWGKIAAPEIKSYGKKNWFMMLKYWKNKNKNDNNNKKVVRKSLQMGADMYKICVGKTPTNVWVLLASSSRISSSYRNKISSTVAKNIWRNAQSYKSC